LLHNKGVGHQQQTENAASIDTSRSWEIIDWQVVRESTEATFAANPVPLQEDAVREQVSAQAGDAWEQFYLSKNDTFYQKRNYLQFVFPELLQGAPTNVVAKMRREENRREERKQQSTNNNNNDDNDNDDDDNDDVDDDDNFEYTFENNSPLIVEVGAGTGSSLFSIATMRPDCRMAACDLSAHAIDLIKVCFRFRCLLMNH
jgi:hypothetical protein